MIINALKTENMKATNKGGATSFHGHVIMTTPNKLIKLANRLGANYWDGNCGTDKTNFDFTFETSNEDVFAVYDWKEYRVVGLDEVVEFHIGAANSSICDDAKRELNTELR